MFKRIIKTILKTMGYTITKVPNFTNIPFDIEEEVRDIYGKFKDYTETSIERVYALYNAIVYIVNFKIPGDIVECGVWKGGSSMISAFTLLEMGETERKIYLYDTYEGMSKPTDKDIKTYDNKAAWERWRELQEKDHNKWCYSPIEEVKANLFSTGYPQENLIFVKGKVEDTIPSIIPDKISLLRLDTDWYESTYHELFHLFPRLSKNGVVIIDDYGVWKGAREATDKYFKKNGINILLNRIDSTCRIGIKVSD